MKSLHKLIEALARLLEGEQEGYWVRGSGVVYVPKDRVNEIPKVIEEHHCREAELERLNMLVRRQL